MSGRWGWARACRKRGRQLALGLALWVTTVGGAVLLFYVFGRRTGEIEPARERAAALGLDPAHPAAVGLHSWHHGGYHGERRRW